MSESVKPRIAVDLDEIERQLAQAQAAPSTRNDPLAELARIVGQDDPFQSLLSQEQQGQQQGRARMQAHNLDDIFRVQEQPVPRATMAPELRAGVEPRAYDLDQYPPPDGTYPSSKAPMEQDEGGYDDHAGYDETYHGNTGVDPYAYEEPLEPRRSRKPLTAIAVVAVAVIGGGAWFFTGKSSMVSTGEPPLIKASNEPTKVQPENPGGVEIPNQNKQIYERAKQTAETKVVDREEQPIDVKEATRIASAGAPDATGTTAPRAPAPQAPAPQASAGNSLNLGEPKKVRTVSIRPDGTVVNGDNSARQAPMPPPAMTLPSAAQPAPPAAQMASTAQPAAQPVRPAASTPTTPAQKPPASPASAGGASPQKVASAQPMSLAPADADTAPAVSAGAGGFAVQLGVRSSEADARKAFSQFQQKYADLQDQPALIQKAEVKGAAVYRVRVGPMSQNDASSLCSKLRGEGGECWVTKN